MYTVADAIATTLRAMDVVDIFGMDSPESFYRAALDVGMKPVTIRDERSAAAMADAYARCTGRVAICTAIQGPGATNLVTTLAEAFHASSPVLALVKDTAVGDDGRNPFQEMPEEEVFAPVVKAVYRVTSAQDASALTVRALEEATTGRPGPVVLLLPGDVLDTELVELAQPALRSHSELWPEPDRLAELRDRLLAADAPLLVAGELAARLPGGLDALAEAIGVPVTMTTLGHGGVSDDNPWSLGLLSAYTTATPRGRQALEYAQRADLVVIVGGRLDALDTDGWTYPGPDADVVWVAPPGLEPPRHIAVDSVIRSDVGVFVRELTAVVGRSRGDEPPTPAPAMDFEDTETLPLQPGLVAREAVASAGRTGSLLVADASFSSAWALALTPSNANQVSLLAPRGMGGLGWSTPAGVGASLAMGGRRVVTLLGDGALGFSVMELETAVRTGAWLTVVLLDNALLGFQHHWERLQYGRTFAPDLGRVDHAALARTLGAHAERLVSLDDVRDYLRRTEDEPGVHMLDVITDGDVPGPISWFATDERAAAVH